MSTFINEKVAMTDFEDSFSNGRQTMATNPQPPDKLPEKSERTEPPSWKMAWIDFTENTTIHGLRFIWMPNAFLVRKLLWLALVLVCAGLLGYQMIDRIIYYYNYPMTVNVNINFNKSLLFPALTLCNQNNFRATQATALRRYRLLEAMFAGAGQPPNTSVFDHYNASDLMLDELYLSTAHSMHDFIVDCKWQDEACGPENFTQVLTDHGVCFTFSSSKRGQPLLVTSTGSDYGLKLTLNVEQYEYMPGPHNAAGIKILLHDNKEYPAVAELGLSIPTGTHAFVGIQVLQINNLPRPHGNCGALTSPYYTDYSTDNCQLACLTDYMNQECGCRDRYMPSTEGLPPVCTLEQYYGCFLKKIGELRNRVREECLCPIPCSFLVFDPAISLATTSVFAADRLLAAASRTSDLETQYLTALETKERIEDIKLDRFLRLEQEAQRRLQTLTSLMLNDVANNIFDTEAAINGVSNDMLSAWATKDYLYQWQEYHVRKNFIRPRDAMNERTFGYLVMGFQEYATLTESQILALTDPDISEPEVRKAIYTILLTSLKAKTDLCDRALANYTQLYQAYYNGTPIFRYKFLTEDIDDNVYITPKVLLRDALSHSYYASIFSSRVGDDIMKYKSSVDTFIELATEAYYNNTLNPNDTYLADVSFLSTGRGYLHSKSQFDQESIEYPPHVLQERQSSFARLWRTYESIVQDNLNNIDSLKTSLERLETSILAPLNHSMKKVREYFTNDSYTKLDIARELTSPHIYEGISDMRVFFQSLRSRGQKIYDNWDRLAAAEIDIMRTIIDDEDMVEYFEYKNMTEFLRDLYNVSEEIKTRYSEYRQLYDFRFLVGSSDSLFMKSLEDLMSDLEDYIKKSVIGTDFIRDNFLRLDVFYREKSYEQITQQTAYDIFALLCDIGGSMGLFVGASVLSIGELVDLLLHHSIYRLTHKP